MDFNFDLKETGIYLALKWAKNPVFTLARIFKRIFLVFFIFTLPLFLYGFLTGSFSDSSNSVLLGLTFIFISFAVYFQLIISFLNSKLKNPNIKNPENLAEFLDFETARAVWAADKFAESAKMPPTNSTALFHFLLEKTSGLEFIFFRVLLDISEIKSIVKNRMKAYREKEAPALGYSRDYQETIHESLKIAKEKGHKQVGVGDILSALAKHDPIFQKILLDANLKIQDIENLTWWQDSFEKKDEERKKWWEYDNLMKKGTLAREWTAGYTITLDRYSIDWTEIAKRRGFPEIIGHKGEIEQVERVLGRREYNNVLLVGDPGVGRKGVVQGLVEKSAFGQSLPNVNYKRVVELDLPALLAGVSNPEEVEAVLDAVFQEAISAGNVILVIDEFHNYIAVQPGPGKIDISGVISSYLHLPEFQVVAITTYAGLHKNIEQNPSILNLFEKVEVAEISDRETLMALENLIPVLEAKYKLFVSYPALREIISLSKRYLTSSPFPKKAMDLLDEVMIYTKKTAKEKIILPKHVAKIIRDKTQVPVGEMEEKEKEILLNLENLIHQRIINQEQAVKDVSSALRRARAEVQVRSAPMGNFLFLGPTGVGKTETSKALAAIYFGSESRMIRLDMSEFQETKDIARLIGSPGEEGMLTTQVRENPFSIILLDEIEKSHPNILNLFLQVLDEGFLTDGLGRKVDFKNSIIIATSNAGYQIILKALEEKLEWSQVKAKLLDYIFDKAIFRPEFINRFDAVVVFQPLSKEHLLAVAELMLQKLKKNLKEKGIEFIITLPLKEKIVELSYNPAFGAREMKRVIQDRVEDILASAILSGELKRGNTVEIDPNEFKLKIQ
ncbi:MAG: ATP-dependent Clp protease ATP-binding subunit [Candidatus Nealsonbacteria bacterium]|nr:ATP-dependent Clp protease ATP-binding subunit [Candidatus Nealsonbacteria bacterium]